MTDPTPQITPPPELVREWAKSCSPYDPPCDHIATQAARWGADQELEACCEFMQHEDFHGFAKELRAARRPKPTSLKEQALSLLPDQPGGITMKITLHPDGIRILRRALEALPE